MNKFRKKCSKKITKEDLTCLNFEGKHFFITCGGYLKGPEKFTATSAFFKQRSA